MSRGRVLVRFIRSHTHVLVSVSYAQREYEFLFASPFSLASAVFLECKHRIICLRCRVLFALCRCVLLSRRAGERNLGVVPCLRLPGLWHDFGIRISDCYA